MSDRIEIIARTERRRKFSDDEKAAILDEADQDGVSVREVATRHSIAESLINNWRSVRRQAATLASEPLAFIPYAVVPAQAEAPSPQAPRKQAAQPTSTAMHGAAEDLVRPHPGNRPGRIDIDLPSGVRLSVDSYVNEKALARVLRTLRAVP